MRSKHARIVRQWSRDTLTQIDYVKFLNAELLTPREDEKL
jgi:hypothetical protein